jgi:type II secretory ATPase GspE/PulE/Tfp pilus assembly ATPase PilB-like protein
VCDAICWNAERGLCTKCAPKLDQEIAAMQADAQVRQLNDKIQQVDWTEDINYRDQGTAMCPSCGQESGGGKFCQHCGGTGFRGRTALYEMMAMTDPLRELILSGASAIELKRQAISDGMKTLRQSGIEKVADGVTSIEEVMRVTMND